MNQTPNLSNTQIRERFCELAPKEWAAQLEGGDGALRVILSNEDSTTFLTIGGTSSFGVNYGDCHAVLVLLDHLGDDYDIGRGTVPGPVKVWCVVRCDDRTDNIERWIHPEAVYAVLMACISAWESTNG